MQISKRLTTVASFVTYGCQLADIGTDHAYVPIYLVAGGHIPSAIAMDIRSGPLEIAKELNREDFNKRARKVAGDKRTGSFPAVRIVFG